MTKFSMADEGNPAMFLRKTVLKTSATSVQKIPYMLYMLSWIIVGSLACAGIICWLEVPPSGGKSVLATVHRGNVHRDKSAFMHAFYLCVNGFTATGLASLDLSKLTLGSQVAICLSIQLGSATMLSLVPAIIRLRNLRSILPATGTFDLLRFKRVPQWLVEYKAIVFLIRIVIGYQVVVYAFYFTCLCVLISNDPAAVAHVNDV
jgi:hypothetical protein